MIGNRYTIHQIKKLNDEQNKKWRDIIDQYKSSGNIVKLFKVRLEETKDLDQEIALMQTALQEQRDQFSLINSFKYYIGLALCGYAYQKISDFSPDMTGLI